MRDRVLDHYTAIAGGGPVELACGSRGSGGLDPPIQRKF